MNIALHAAPALPSYPPGFPLPDASPYSTAVDMGVIRSAMAAGNIRQRRTHNNMPTAFALTFHMNTAELFGWQEWVNGYAYGWFYMPLASMVAGYANQLVTYQAARFISDLAQTMDGYDWWSVTVAAELNPSVFASLPNATDRGWLIAGTPAAPSTPDRTLAGTPAAPSTDWTYAGEPSFPASP